MSELLVEDSVKACARALFASRGRLIEEDEPRLVTTDQEAREREQLTLPRGERERRAATAAAAAAAAATAAAVGVRLLFVGFVGALAIVARLVLAIVAGRELVIGLGMDAAARRAR
tara:strand:- start:171 stop:518 length:348 start_codon:yes stop_codon:yes gene_type:complete